MSRWRQLYRMRPLSGVSLVAPLLLLVSGFSWQVYRELRYERDHWAPNDPITLESYHIALHDSLKQNLKRWPQFWLNTSENLPVFDLRFRSKDSQALFSPKQPDIHADLSFNQQHWKADIHLRGSKAWHLNGAKKSLRIKLDSSDLQGNLIQGQRSFNLETPHSPLLIDEALILALARERGLLSTESDFAKLRLNGLDLGVFHWSSSADEQTLRRHRRIPGNLYALEASNQEDFRQGWQAARYWKRLAAYNSQQNQRHDLEALVTQIQREPSPNWASDHLDLLAFARLQALRIVFGAEKNQNFALYAQPYSGRWEPVVYEFDGFHHQMELDLAPNPLLDYLAKIPAYQRLLQQELQRLLKGPAQPDQIQQRAQALIQRLTPALQHDPYWQANRQLPKINRLLRQRMRPMDLPRLQRVLAAEMATYRQRYAWLQAQLSKLPMLPLAVAPLPHQEVTLGPGRIHLQATRVFGPHQTVTIQAGTQFELEAGVSLIFRGPVHVNGTAQQGVSIRPATQAAWGGVVLQGSGTAGSRLSYFQLFGGSVPSWDGRHYPGMLNIHDSHDIALTHTLLKANQVSDDAAHIAYVSQLQARHNRVEKAFSDGWDLEFSSGEISNLSVVEAGDDGLDLMDSHLQLNALKLLYCQGHAISIGEQSKVQLNDSLLARSESGVLVKNVSELRLKRSLIYQNNYGIVMHQDSAYYPGQSRLQAQSLFLVNNHHDEELDAASQAYVQWPERAHDLKSPARLQPLLADLALNNWGQLKPWIQAQRELAL